jgi:hypothetical protein
MSLHVKQLSDYDLQALESYLPAARAPVADFMMASCVSADQKRLEGSDFGIPTAAPIDPD